MSAPQPVLERLRRRVAEDPSVAAAGAAQGSVRRLEVVRGAVARAVREEGVLLPAVELTALVRELADTLAGLGPVEGLLR
ncbi:MAG TPA: hypothetical protein VNU01_04345, partial [Egibacteraceae bacterium]|nr:hypothetical protein [Egibacteraceae bacterium]